jgi:3-hydroxyisobutyrate dehydrogenase
MATSFICELKLATEENWMTNVIKPRVGWIGLGKMGVPICKRIWAAGHDVTAFVRNETGRQRASELGLISTDSLAGVVIASDVVFSAISDDKALLDIVAGSSGLAAHMSERQVFVDMSTVSPAASVEAAKLFLTPGVAYLRSPVSGSTATAEAGQLTVLVSGPRAAFDRTLALFGTFSHKQFYLGDGDQARYLKIVLNAMVGATSALLAEALTLGRKGGLDVATMLEVVNASAVASPLIAYKTNMLVTGDFTPAFTVAGMIKDFDIALSIGRCEHIPLPLIAQIRQQYEAAFAGGGGDEDFFVLARGASRAAGFT